jgi:hypothetical protein
MAKPRGAGSAGHDGDDELSEAVRRTRRRIRSFIAAFIATAAIGLLAVVIVVAISAASVARSFSHIGQRNHLQPIPVAKNACPYIVAMHNAADAFQNQTPLLGFGADGRGHLLPWPTTRLALSHAADVLDVTIAAGIPHVPPPVQAYLTTVRADIKQGREQASLTNDPNAYLQRVEPLLTSGQRAFGFAGDLVGHACSVDLGADNGVVAATNP